MQYTLNKTVSDNLENTKERVPQAFSNEGFGILFQINMHEKFKAALDKDFRPYIVLGACRPQGGYEAISEDESMGAFLPCHVVIQKSGENETQVNIVDPKVSMSMVENEKIQKIAEDIKARIQKVIEKI